MRVTTRWLQQSALLNLRRGTSQLARAQAEASTGQRVRTVSDAPLDAGQVMRLDGELRDIERYRRNGTWATTRMAAEDTVLTHARELLDQARKIAIAAAPLPAGDPARVDAAAQVDRLREQVIALGNTRMGQDYLFGGGRSTSPPFLPGGAYVGDGTVRRAEVDAGVVLDTTDTGSRVFGDALAGLSDLANGLRLGDTGDVQARVGVLSDAADGMLQVQTALGGRMKQIADTATRLAVRASRTADQRDTIRDVDPAEAAVNLTAAQTALQQAYAVVSKVLSVNLLDYFR